MRWDVFSSLIWKWCLELLSYNWLENWCCFFGMWQFSDQSFIGVVHVCFKTFWSWTERSRCACMHLFSYAVDGAVVQLIVSGNNDLGRRQTLCEVRRSERAKACWHLWYTYCAFDCLSFGIYLEYMMNNVTIKYMYIILPVLAYLWECLTGNKYALTGCIKGPLLLWPPIFSWISIYLKNKRLIKGKRNCKSFLSS